MVSVIIPIHNVESYIERCLNSVIQQTYHDIECILIDDACTDQSMTISERITSAYIGPITFKTVHFDKSVGPSGARNKGTEVANGEYIFYLDSDDEITPDCLELMIGIANQYPEVEIVQGGIWAEKDPWYYDLSRYHDLGLITDNTWIRKEFYRRDKGLPCTVWNKLIKKNFLLKNKIVFEPDIIHEDELWMYCVSRVLSNIYFLPDITYKHYSVPGSIMTDLQVEYSYHSWAVVLDRIINLMDKPLLEEQVRKYLFFILDREIFFEQFGKSKYLLDKISHVACQKIWLALKAYQFLKGPSIRMFVLHYCLTGNTRGVYSQIYYDIRDAISRKIK